MCSGFRKNKLFDVFFSCTTPSVTPGSQSQFQCRPVSANVWNQHSNPDGRGSGQGPDAPKNSIWRKGKIEQKGEMSQFFSSIRSFKQPWSFVISPANLCNSFWLLLHLVYCVAMLSNCQGILLLGNQYCQDHGMGQSIRTPYFHCLGYKAIYLISPWTVAFPVLKGRLISNKILVCLFAYQFTNLPYLQVLVSFLFIIFQFFLLFSKSLFHLFVYPFIIFFLLFFTSVAHALLIFVKFLDADFPILWPALFALHCREWIPL